MYFESDERGYRTKTNLVDHKPCFGLLWTAPLRKLINLAVVDAHTITSSPRSPKSTQMIDNRQSTASFHLVCQLGKPKVHPEVVNVKNICARFSTLELRPFPIGCTNRSFYTPGSRYLDFVSSSLPQQVGTTRGQEIEEYR